MSHRNNLRRIPVNQLGFSDMLAAEFVQGGLLTSQQSAACFPAEDFRNRRIITEPTISFPNKKLAISMIRLARAEGTAVAAAEPLMNGLLFAGGAGSVLTLNELAREADAARRER